MSVSHSTVDGAVMPAPDILSKPEAAQLLRIRRRTLDEWMRRGRIPFVKLPSGAVRFRRDHLLDFLTKFEIGNLDSEILDLRRYAHRKQASLDPGRACFAKKEGE